VSSIDSAEVNAIMGKDESPDLSTSIRTDYQQPRLYVTLDSTEYPPIIVRFYAETLRQIQQMFTHCFERVLRDAGKLQTQITPRQRAEKLSRGELEVKTEVSYGREYELAALRDRFGEWQN